MNKSVRAPLLIGLIVALAGVAIIGMSVQSMIFGPNSAVECNGKVMTPDEVCETTTSYGSTTTASYDELKSAKKRIVAPVIGIVFGALVLGVGGVVLFVLYRITREQPGGRSTAPPGI